MKIEGIEIVGMMYCDIYLKEMDSEMYHKFFRKFENDIDLYFDKSEYEPYIYSEEKVGKYIRRIQEKKRVPLAIMNGDEIIGEILFKNIEEKRCATLSIVLINSDWKNKGIGTRAELLAIDYAFNQLGVKELYADAIVTNTRSQHVLEKVGFKLIKEENNFKFYKVAR